MRNKKCKTLFIKGSILFFIFLALSSFYWIKNKYLYLDGNEFFWFFMLFSILGSITSGIMFWLRYGLCLMGEKF